jgi:hypothetical protein
MEHDRRPDLAVHADGQSLVGPNHAGVTVAQLALADEVDGLTEAEARG